MTRLRFVLLLALSLALLAPAGAAASSRQLSVMQDDGRILHGSPQTRDETLNEMDALGTDVVKVQLTWREVAPATRPVDPANPAFYNWGLVDAAVAGIRARGMRPYLTIGGRAPNYAVGRQTPRFNGTYRPSAPEFELFARAAGRRYAGLVDIWSIWNEPGLTTWIQPQRDRRRRPLSPSIYRSLYLAGHRGLSDSGHAGDTILLGELAPIGSRSSNKVGPVEFIRELACLDRRYRPLRGSARRARRCPASFRRIPTSGLAYHPYTTRRGPRSIPRARDDAPIGALSRVTRALDRVARRGRISRGRRVWITEFGFQTNPPDRFQIPIRRVPGYMDFSEYLAFRSGACLVVRPVHALRRCSERLGPWALLGLPAGPALRWRRAQAGRVPRVADADVRARPSWPPGRVRRAALRRSRHARRVVGAGPRALPLPGLGAPELGGLLLVLAPGARGVGGHRAGADRLVHAGQARLSLSALPSVR